MNINRHRLYLQHRGLLLMGLLAWSVVGVMSLLPPDAKVGLHTQGVLHPWLHLGSFLVVASLCTAGAPNSRTRTIFFVAILLFGLGSEIAEHLINATALEVSDIFADTVGASLGLLGTLLFWQP